MLTAKTIHVYNHTFHVKEVKKEKNGKQYLYFRVRFTIDQDPVSGKRKEAEITAVTMEELKTKLEDRLRPFQYRLNQLAAETTLKSWLSTWYGNNKISWKDTTRQSYRIRIAFISKCIGDIKLSDLHEDMIQVWYNNLCQAGCSASQVLKVHSVLKNALSDAVTRTYLSYNPCDRVHLPKKIHSRVTILSLDEQKQLLKAISGHPYECIYGLALSTGMRIGEILGLCYEQIDFEHHQITVDRQLVYCSDDNGVSRTRLQYSTKTGGIRYVHMNAAAESYLKQEMKKHGGTYQPDELIFQSSGHPFVPYNSVSRDFRKFCDDLGIHAHIHTLRHTAASNMYHQSRDMRFVQEQLGHSDQRTTYYYTHTRFEDLKEYIDRQDKDYEEILPECRRQLIRQCHKQS